ncbi:pre-peptidase C-terminal domain-containing protein [Nostoc sp. FACHB-152]|uniref:pre-peptidase C-terminal domain-containing protein n=1 Tax=unclassified Nostoc TaxID=2593658 RepID=UPI0016868904|nr:MULTISPECIES: pre-peptidase C-terminal domain-containing protein [unclassified Nostoc]MBD2449119.1 pre-peptidase C-terminal domain-containing protein [Nostoc sp. FACHB-152]MBD2470375.1 pre-peptidase C-terminal domain-containing protein [Nostoc sp. FACHB-145]
MVTSTYTVGSLGETPVERSNYLGNYFTQDVYNFSTSGTNSINLSLHNITVGDDADLKLYQDVNSDGSLDSSDTLILSSSRGSNLDDAINYVGSAGSYLAVVDKYLVSDNDGLNYELDLSATPQFPYYTSAPNLLPKEIELGTISTSNQTGSLGDNNTVDTYFFSVSSIDSLELNASLTGLTGDADIRLIQDNNGNQIVDSDEILAYSRLGSSSSESLNYGVNSGDYFVQVYQYSGSTDYNLSITTSSTLLLNQLSQNLIA